MNPEITTRTQNNLTYFLVMEINVKPCNDEVSRKSSIFFIILIGVSRVSQCMLNVDLEQTVLTVDFEHE